MDKRWKMQAIAACTILMLLIGTAGAQCAAILCQGGRTAKAEAVEPATAARWATVMTNAATHEGPGLRYAMTGMIRMGHAVEVVNTRDGWCKCLTWMSEEPVWIFGEYLEFDD